MSIVPKKRPKVTAGAAKSAARDPFRAVREKLKAWRTERNLKASHAAKAAGVSASFWCDIEKGLHNKRPQGINAQLIEVVTGGRVKAVEWLLPHERARVEAAQVAALVHAQPAQREGEAAEEAAS